MEGPVDLPERQRTLRAAIDWSYQRLTASQRELHGALAVFADSAALDDARAVARSRAGVPRTISRRSSAGASSAASHRTARCGSRCSRPSASMRVDRAARRTAQLDELRTRHADRFLALALAAESELAGSEQARWLARLEREFDNLTAALDWLLASGRIEDALRATSALEPLLAWTRARHRGAALARARPRARRRRRPGRPRGRSVDRSPAGGCSERLAGSANRRCKPLCRSFAAAGRAREVAFTLSELAFIAIRRDELERRWHVVRGGARRRPGHRRRPGDVGRTPDARRDPLVTGQPRGRARPRRGGPRSSGDDSGTRSS